MKFQKSDIEQYSFTEKEPDLQNELADTNQTGGACTRNKLYPNQYTIPFEKYGIPVGLVLNPISSIKRGGSTEKDSSIYFNHSKNKNAEFIDDKYFDKLYDMSHKKIPYMHKTTQKQKR